MNRLDGLLEELIDSPRDGRAHDLAARYAPILCFDAREPFLPVAAGITLFESDGPSPSMRRTIELAPPEKPAAVAAIEYAIWWDWDIHHLYELEHVWVYLDGQGQLVRVEASWHGKYNELALWLEGERAVVLSEPGKHAFADRPEPFLQRAAAVRRPVGKQVGSLAHVLINEMFGGQIRRRPYDDSLARAYLLQQAFEPAWDFSQRFRFDSRTLVPWPVLAAFIPKRVNAWLEALDSGLSPAEYRALRLTNCSGSPAELQAVIDSGADGVVLPVTSGAGGQPLVGEIRSLADIFPFLRSVPMRAVLDLQDEGCIEALAGFLNEKKLYGLAPVMAANPAWLAKLKTLAPRAWVIAPAGAPEQEPLAAAAACGAGGVLLPFDLISSPERSAAWIEQAHASGLTVMSPPVADPQAAAALERQRLDVLWYAPPAGPDIG